ncbi:MAG: hypothetical protein AAGB02_04765 [Pseudomonadota bacterium]
MIQPNLSDARIFNYQFDVSIACPPSRVWALMIENINAWWMNDFRCLGEDSVLSLEAAPGGQLLETSSDGRVLEWYRVQMCEPGKALYLVGYLAPDWGGPTLSMLKLLIEQQDTACALQVSDAMMGNVTKSSIQSVSDGWRKLFGEALREYAEAHA